MDWPINYIGLPYKPGGRDRAGIDCWGLVCLVARERFGWLLPAHDETVWRSTGDSIDVAAVAEAEARSWHPVERAAERAGDVILIRRGRSPIHVGIVTEPGFMLHVEQGTNSVHEHYRSLKWRARTVGIYRWREALNA